MGAMLQYDRASLILIVATVQDDVSECEGPAGHRILIRVDPGCSKADAHAWEGMDNKICYQLLATISLLRNCY